MTATLDKMGPDPLLYMITTELLSLPSPEQLAKLIAAHRASRSLFLGVAQKALHQRLTDLSELVTECQLACTAIAKNEFDMGTWFYDPQITQLPKDTKTETVVLWAKREVLQQELKLWFKFTIRFYKAHGWNLKLVEQLCTDAEKALRRESIKTRIGFYWSRRNEWFWVKLVKEAAGPAVFLMGLRKRKAVSYKEVDDEDVESEDNEDNEE